MTPPASTPLRPSSPRNVHRTLAAAAAALACGPASSALLTVTVADQGDKPLAEAVVYVMVRGAPGQASPGTSAEISQRDRQFHPRVSVVQTGTAVRFPNHDTVRHHVYSFSPAKTFELKLYAGTPAAPVVFDKAGTATLGCNIHDRMAAWVHVVETPHFAKTDAKGRATLELPAGEHRLHAWHRLLPDPGTALEQSVRVGTDAVEINLRLTTSQGAAE